MAPRSVYGGDPYRLVERRFAPAYLAQAEALFALSNGWLGVRGTLEESQPCHQRATLINGFHESWPIEYGEEAHGFAKTGQTIVPVPDGTLIKLYVDDEPFDVSRAIRHRSERVLDMRTGMLEREVVWERADGRRLALRSKRLVSLEHRHVVAMSYEVEVLDEPATLTIASEIVPTHHKGPSDHGDPRRSRTLDEDVMHSVLHQLDGQRALLALQTVNSGMAVACGMEHIVDTAFGWTERLEGEDDWARQIFLVDAEPGRPFRIVKMLAYHASGTSTATELAFRVRQSLDGAIHAGWEQLVAVQRERMADFWRRTGVDIEGAPELEQAVRFNLFQVHQASARCDGHGVPSKGLTGTGYEGHYFWDAEIYVIPFLTYTSPHIAKNLLRFREQMLDAARQRAAEVGHRGALYPWRTITGEEASSYYAAGTAQYHINADIVYALQKYVWATGDLDFLARSGVEVLVETARLFVDLGFFNPRMDGAFCINGVTGPDEYTTVVNNNAYTNLMAQENLRAAVNAVEWLRVRRPDDYEYLVHTTALDPTEVEVWRQAAEHMYVPYDEEARVHLQDDAFLDREVWDFDHTPADKYPLLLHYHPLEIYRHQVIKQADVALAAFLVGHNFSFEDKQRIFDYYDPLTTGDSSLSKSVQSIVAAEIGRMETAATYFAEAVLIDLLDLAGNVRDGLHIASAGGVWMTLVYGFAGLRDHDTELRFRPAIPEGWEVLRFRLRRRDSVLEVEIRDETTTYRLLESGRLVVHHWGTEVVLATDEDVVLDNPHLSPAVHELGDEAAISRF
jgi:alpha,alpha-trehalose phosphorylase